MRKLLMLILLIPFALQAQYNVRQNKGVVINGINIRYSVHIPYTPPTPPAAELTHPITHDQYYVSHPNVANGDSIGIVHYLCTDSIFNDRSSGSYSWSIISGNVGTAYAITSNTGMLKVNDAADIVSNGDYTLGVEISHGSDKDTASCYIEYRSGTVIYVDAGHGGSDLGTWANPYVDLNDIDNGELTGGETVLLKRGTGYYPNVWHIENQSNKIVIGAYGAGAKPILYGSNVDQEHIINLGTFWAVGTGVDNVDDADSVVIMDIHFIGLDSDTYQHFAIYHQNFSDNNEYHRLLTEKCGNGNGTFDFVGEWTLDIKIRDCGITDPWTSGTNDHWRAFKFEAGGGIDLENVWYFDMRGPGIMCGLWDSDQNRDFGSLKYIYGDMADAGVGTWGEACVQIRDRGATVEWLASNDYGYGFELQNHLYGGSYGDPNPRKCTLKNARIVDAIDGIAFYDDTDPGEAGDFDSAYFENIYVHAPHDNGIDFNVRGCNDCRTLDEIDLVNFLVVDAADDGISFLDTGDGTPDATEWADIRVSNGIIYNSTDEDIATEATMSGVDMRNIIYETATNTSHFGTWGAENHDIAGGTPFNDAPNGDYTTASDETVDIINQGFDWSHTTDMLYNDISDQDVSPFEYGGTNYNWTDIE